MCVDLAILLLLQRHTSIWHPGINWSPNPIEDSESEEDMQIDLLFEDHNDNRRLVGPTYYRESSRVLANSPC